MFDGRKYEIFLVMRERFCSLSLAVASSEVRDVT
jgi:hypothetical protein